MVQHNVTGGNTPVQVKRRQLKQHKATFDELKTALDPVLTAPNKATTLAALGNWAGATAADRSLALLFLMGVAFTGLDYLIEKTK